MCKRSHTRAPLEMLNFLSPVSLCLCKDMKSQIIWSGYRCITRPHDLNLMVNSFLSVYQVTGVDLKYLTMPNVDLKNTMSSVELHSRLISLKLKTTLGVYPAELGLDTSHNTGITVGYLSVGQIHADLHITCESVSLHYFGEIQYNNHDIVPLRGSVWGFQAGGESSPTRFWWKTDNG